MSANSGASPIWKLSSSLPNFLLPSLRPPRLCVTPFLASYSRYPQAQYVLPAGKDVGPANNHIAQQKVATPASRSASGTYFVRPSCREGRCPADNHITQQKVATSASRSASGTYCVRPSCREGRWPCRQSHHPAKSRDSRIPLGKRDVLRTSFLPGRTLASAARSASYCLTTDN